MKTKQALYTLSALLLASAASASITSGIENGDFSNDGLTGGFQVPIADWGQTGGTFLEARDADMGTTQDPGDPAAGIEASDAYIFQEFGVHDTSNELFEVSMFTGMTDDRPGTADLDIQLWYGTAGQSGSSLTGTLLEAVDFTEMETAGGTVAGSGTVTVQIGTTGVATSGQSLYLVVLAEDMVTNGGNTAQLFVDGITLTAIPEASSFALLAGLCGLASVKLRRRH